MTKRPVHGNAPGVLLCADHSLPTTAPVGARLAGDEALKTAIAGKPGSYRGGCSTESQA